MTFRHFISTLAVVAVTSIPAVAQTQAPPKPEQKPAPAGEKPAAVNVAGKWTVTIDLQGQQRTSSLDLKVEGTKVTGTINSELGEAQLAGEYADGKLKFGFTMDANGTPLQVGFVGAVQKDGTLAGTLDFGQGEIPWTAVRAKN